VLARGSVEEPRTVLAAVEAARFPGRIVEESALTRDEADADCTEVKKRLLATHTARVFSLRVLGGLKEDRRPRARRA
jgi:hypothetical protein